MATLVFDIETVGEDWDELDAATQASLTRWIDRSSLSPSERQAKLVDLQSSLGFSPFTGVVVSIALYDVERGQGAVYYQAAKAQPAPAEDSFVYKIRSEGAMLEEFWEGAREYDRFVTFNGRQFDVPFLWHRSAMQGVRPSIDLMAQRYLRNHQTIYHVDLADQFSFYGAMTRRPNLHLVCRAYGIDSPKGDGVSGDDVASLYQAGEFETIARYNARDVTATTELYQVWQQYFNL